jgi:hypothetical protein
MSLVLHCGAEHVSRDVLGNLPVPAPRGARHVTRPFIEDVELVDRFLANEGFKVKDEAFGVVYEAGSATPRRFFGLMEVALPGFDADDSYGLTVGLRGSYDQSLPRGLAVGSRVFVCDNLAFSAEITMITKQTTFIGNRIPTLLANAVAQIPGVARHQQMRFDAYRNIELKPRWGDAALIEMVRRDIINPSQLGRAISEWDHPSFEEHESEGRSAWRLYNAVTYAIKPPADSQRADVLPSWERTTKLTSFLDEVSGL